MYSEPEIELFDVVNCKLNDNEKIYYGGNQFFSHFKDLGRTFSYDFVYKNKVIEFNGDYWHCNPKKYNKNYFHKYLQLSAFDVWERDKMKNNAIQEQGFDVLVIWEDDYKQNRNKVIQECIEFLK